MKRKASRKKDDEIMKLIKESMVQQKGRERKE